jgi:hypothetical protein
MMGTNFHEPWIDASTQFIAADMNLPLSTIDRVIGYLKNLIVHCDGSIEYHPMSGILYWSGALRFIFNRADGQACTNYAEIGSVQLGDNEFAYVDLDETNGTEVTVQKATVTGGAASNFIAFNRVVLGYRNAVSNDFYPVHLRQPWPTSVGS